MQKVIISGADGFVGSYTTNYFLNQGVEVLALGRKKQPCRLQKRDGLQYVSCDVFNPQELEKCLPSGEYDAFLHFAWVGSAGEERMNYQLQMRNVIGTVECMKIAHSKGCKRFVGAGSIMEYEAEAAVHKQESRPGMAYIYGMAKQTAHSICKSVANQIGIEFVWPMITNAYGVGEMSPRFINTTLRKMIHNEPLEFTAATQNYDFVYITDVAKAFYLVTLQGIPFCEYMIGSGHAKQLREFILQIQQALAPHNQPLFGNVPFTGTTLPLEVYSIKDIEKDCGYVAEVDIVEGARKTMQWLREMERAE